MTIETYLNRAGSLADLTLRDGKLRGEVSDAVIGTPNLDLTSSEVSQLKIQLLDPDFSLYKSGLFNVKTAMAFGAHPLEIAASGVTGDSIPVIEVTARAAGVQKLRRATGPQIVSNVSPTDYARSEAERVGLAFVGQASAVQAQVARGGGTAEAASETTTEESTWDVIQRLAGEIGFIAFEARNTLFFGKPSWLVTKAGKTHTVRYPKGVSGELTPFGVPTCRRSVDNPKNAVSVDVTVDIADAVKIAPGDRLKLRGVPGFEGDYMVDALTIDIDGVSPVTVRASTPVDPDPRPPAPPDTYNDRSEADRFVRETFFPPPEPPPGLTSTETVWGSYDAKYIWPTTEHTISSRFGPRRSPGGIGSTNHQGIDIRAGRGRPIRATRAGTVTVAGWAGGYGNAVYIDHGGGAQSRYGHMLMVLTKVGARVAQGQVIGSVDSTGQSTGDHLHFELRFNGRATDPLPFLEGRKQPVVGVF